MLEQEKASESAGPTSLFINEEAKVQRSEQVRDKDPGIGPPAQPSC